ncbi:Membrane protein involved in the export of O-antigen and teichoic acid [Candidatus Koribacter versatilis Ellin345]|uniref:Membrane protein involved in the export of O-antigen and teichoic acid n=1 Tax=Koribacter versatilis (strain Ellin345) TaxID=204669 RepID=Q1ILE0_KORVE|nr:lipopolysaccharide biosynthesis protein [Candidatus Koribacter versatilis]ABF42310.1 Membrane protein involved in the export of O-antigen and teichoic acid [Candidatus Koribacter versatilis Ellin345]
MPVVPKKKPGGKSFIADLLATGATEAAVFLAIIINISLVSRLLGVIALAQFLLVRRVYAWMQSGTQLGLSVSLPRHIAHDVDRETTGPRYFFTAIVWGALSAATTALVFFAGGKYSAKLMYGGAEYQMLVAPLSALLVASIIHVMVYGYHRGLNRMGTANWLMVLNMAVVPLLMTGVAWRYQSVVLLLYLQAAGMAVVSIAMAPRFRRLPAFRAELQFKPLSKSLLSYGILRMPGEIGFGALIALGPVIAMHYTSISEVSVLLLGMSALTAVSLAVTPLGTLLLAKISIMLSEGRMDDVRMRVGMLCDAVLQVSTFLFLQCLILCGPIVTLWVGSGFHGQVSVLRAVLLSVPFYTVFVSTRSVIDAASTKPYNARNVLISLSVFAVCAGIACWTKPQPFTLAIGGAIFASLAVLGVLSWRMVHSLLSIESKFVSLLPVFATNLVLGGLSVAVYRLCSYRMNFFVLAGLEIAEVVVLLAVINKLQSPWWVYLVGALRKNQGNPTAEPIAQVD